MNHTEESLTASLVGLIELPSDKYTIVSKFIARMMFV
jgi:hypothetical protein